MNGAVRIQFPPKVSGRVGRVMLGESPTTTRSPVQPGKEEKGPEKPLGKPETRVFGADSAVGDAMGRRGARGGPSSSGIPAGRGGARRGGAPRGRGSARPSARGREVGGPGWLPFVPGAPPSGPARGRRPGPTPRPPPCRLRARARFRPLFLPEEERGSCSLSSECDFGVPCLLLPRRHRPRPPLIFVWRPRAPGSTLGGAAAPAPGR